MFPSKNVLRGSRVGTTGETPNRLGFVAENEAKTIVLVAALLGISTGLDITEN